MCRHILELWDPECKFIIGADGNLETSSPKWGEVEKMMGKIKVIRAEWNLPNHAGGRTIDHVHVDQLIADHNQIHLSATPTEKKDHYILITLVGSHGLHQSPKLTSIHEWFFREEGRREHLMDLLGPFEKNQEMGYDYIQRLKCQDLGMWKNYVAEGPDRAKNFDSLRRIMHGIQEIREKGFIHQVIMTQKGIRAEITGTTVAGKEKRKANWRRTAVPTTLAEAKLRANELAEAFN